MIDDEQPTVSARAAFGWSQYYDINGIYEWLDQMLRRFPAELTGYNIGKTFEKRTIRGIKLSRRPERVIIIHTILRNIGTNASICMHSNLNSIILFPQKNPTIFIESTIHAREWITVATATYLLNELLTSNDPENRYLADNYDWVIVPVVNVDGYVYTHTRVSHGKFSILNQKKSKQFHFTFFRIVCGVKHDDHIRAHVSASMRIEILIFIIQVNQLLIMTYWSSLLNL